MEKALVSVIIPVYNAEKYLDKCLYSIISQTYQHIEIIIVDDGSIDGSHRIYQKYQTMDTRIYVIRKNHEGVSQARNTGIQACNGYYLLFVDADDYTETQYVETMVNRIQNSDIAICAYKRLNQTEKSIVYRKSGTVSKEELFIHTFCSNLIGGACWNKIFKMSLIKQEKIEFDETISMGEDMLFLAEYYRFCKEAIYVETPLYCYRCNPDSIMQHAYKNRQFYAKTASCLEAADRIGILYQNEKEVIKNCIAYREVRTGLWVLYQMMYCRYEDFLLLEKIKTIIRRNFKRYYRSQYATLLERGAAIAVCIFPKTFYRIGNAVLSGSKEKSSKYFT